MRQRSWRAGVVAVAAALVWWGTVSVVVAHAQRPASKGRIGSAGPARIGTARIGTARAPTAHHRPASEPVDVSPCGPIATTLRADRVARIWQGSRSIDGCAHGGRPVVALGSDGPCPGRSPQVGRIALAGAVAAVALRSCGIDTSSASVAVVALRSGRRLRLAAALTTIPGVESFQSVSGLVVRPDGAAAWIVTATSVVVRRPVTEVVIAAGPTVRALDTGARIARGSLTLHGTRLRWRDGRATRTATLN